ncbi:Na+/H+ antiporter NhaC family protein [Thermoproteota archaeon]
MSHRKKRWTDMFRSPAAWVFFISIFLSFYVGKYVAPTWTIEKVSLDVQTDTNGALYFIQKGEPKYLDKVIPYESASLKKDSIKELNRQGQKPQITEEYAYEFTKVDGKSEKVFYSLSATRHWKFWSFLPAFVAICLCWLTKEPVAALSGGIVAGAFLLGKYDISESVLIPTLMTKSAAGVLILYLWFLGGLMGIWSRTGAAQAFADMTTKHFVKGPRTAKLVAWMLGTIFFQGGTVSTVLVGTTVKPIADKENVSHEELSYIVDSNASAIATILAFNAWPGYVQAFIYVAGVSFLATEADRIAFFFKSIPFCFYGILAVTFTFLLAIEKMPYVNGYMKKAMDRARKHNQLDAPDAEPLSAKELQSSHVPEGYTPSVWDFFVPLGVLIGIAISTFIFTGSPQVRWAFGISVLVAISMALLKGMRLRDITEGLCDGFKGVVLGALILLLAVTIGQLSKETGAGVFIVELLGERIPYWILPVILQFMTMLISFSTGTSWGTYAVAFPLAMPLAWAVAGANDLAHPMIYMQICFATVLNGSIFGDQCSPISDTTVLSAMCSGCDLMDHVKTQLGQAAFAAGIAAIAWTVAVLILV